MAATKKLLWIALKSFIVITISFTILVTIRPISRPFLCNDISLSHPKNNDTVGNITMYLLGLSPILIIFLSEVIFNWKFTFINRLKISWGHTAYLYRKYLINFAMLHVIMVGAKISTGRHRPHFFDTCKPDTLQNCTAGQYVYSFKCTNTEGHNFWSYDASMSFFSGHAIISAYAAFFLIFYYHIRMRKNRFVRSLLLILLALIAYFVAVSRVFDQRHWVTDVIVGGILGIIFAYHAWYVQCKNLKIQTTQNNLAEGLPLNQQRLSQL